MATVTKASWIAPNTNQLTLRLVPIEKEATCEETLNHGDNKASMDEKVEPLHTNDENFAQEATPSAECSICTQVPETPYPYGNTEMGDNVFQDALKALKDTVANLTFSC